MVMLDPSARTPANTTIITPFCLSLKPYPACTHFMAFLVIYSVAVLVRDLAVVSGMEAKEALAGVEAKEADCEFESVST